MKKNLLSLFLFSLWLNSSIAQDHTITLQGIAFSPNNLTINVGESVKWDNLGGTHNVNGTLAAYPMNPEGFGNGSAAPAPWDFTHTFTQPGTYNYHCDPHESFGMTGVITVVAAMAGDVVISEINYNNPSTDDYEFFELYNNGDEAVNMEGWTVEKSAQFTFPAFTLGAGEYVVLAGSSADFDPAFGLTTFDYASNLTNTSDTIELLDGNGNQVDIVIYADSAPWPTLADGGGPSLVLCDYDSDNNDGANWAAANTPTGVEFGGTEILANPGADSECLDGPLISLQGSGFTVLENAGSVFVTLFMSNGDAGTTTVDLVADMASTAVAGQDFALTLPFTVTFDAGVAMDTQTVVINLIDDMDIEDVESLILKLENPTNGGNISAAADEYTLTILDDDTPPTNALIITGVFDTQPAGAGAKGIELKALANIPNLSIFGVGSANNGTGTSGVETQLPAISVQEGDCVYVTDDSLDFITFFGFSPTIEGGAANINGDDAIELFENSVPIDVFGDIFTDGTGEPWEYLDGWAYRVSETTHDGTVFNVDNWTYSGNGALAVENNSVATTPFPTCSYLEVLPASAVANDDNVTVPFNTAFTINVLGNDVLVSDLTSITVTVGPSNGTATANGTDNITYTPTMDYCGPDEFTYEICDAQGCDQATVSITVLCPPTYPAYDIATVTTVNADGLPDSSGVSCQIQGIVHGIDLQGGAQIQFTVIDGTGGISTFGDLDFGYTVNEGDEVIVRGKIEEFFCLTQIAADTVILVSSGNGLATPEVTTFLDEDFESEMVFLTNVQLTDVGDWLGDGSSFNVEITNGTFTNIMRIDNDTEMASEPWPGGTLEFSVRGIGGQFDNQGVCDGGYQLLPRYWDDFDLIIESTFDPALGEKINFFPNPATDQLTIQTDDVILEKIMVSNLVGQRVMEVENPGNVLNVSDLQSGVYLLTFQVSDSIWTAKFVKN